MNYIKLLNTFEDYCERTGLPTYVQLIYYKLLAIDNRAGWAEWFEASNHYLMFRVGLKDEQTFIDYRNTLKQKGFVDFISGKKGSPTKYKILEKNTWLNPVNSQVNHPVNNQVNSPVETLDIYKPKDKEKEKQNIPYVEILNYLNEACGTKYKSVESNNKHIRARWNDGYRFDDFKTVIDKKTKEWLSTEQAKYLRPETLFGNKFDGYLNQISGSGKEEEMIWV